VSVACLQVTDFFTAGLGFDIAGAFLVARGLIADPAELNRVAGSFYGSNPYQAVSRARDRIDAISGLAALGLGFLLQGVGYLSLLAGAGSEMGTSEAVAGAVVMAAASLLTLLAAAGHRKLRHVPLLVEMSRRTLDGGRLDYPSA
jgi:hypothetical protein